VGGGGASGNNVEYIKYPSGSRHIYCFAYYVTPPPTSGEDREGVISHARMTQRKPMWLVEVSTVSLCLAAGR
jgi:hypothetical protein